MSLNTLGSIISYNARTYPSKVAFTCEDRFVTFKQFNERVNRLANYLIARGLKKQDRLGILSTNRIEMAEAYGAAEKVGFIAVPMNFRYERGDVEYIVRHAEISAIVVLDEYLPLVEGLPVGERIVFSATGSPVANYEQALAGSSADEPCICAAEDDIVYMMYTGGTTGRPKGVLLDHRGQVHNAKTTLIDAAISPDDRLMTVMPLYHIGGKNFTTVHFHRGCTNVLVPSFRAPEVLHLFATSQTTCVLLAPTMIKMLVDELAGQTFQGTRFKNIYYSSAPMPVALLREAINSFGRVFMQFYGLTESGPSGSCLRKEDHQPDGSDSEQRRLMSAGRPMAYNEVSIVDDEGRELAVGEVGEVRIRADQIMRGYWRNDVASKEAVRGGWVHSGDLGQIDEDGYLYIVGRKKDVIISGGENIYPREIEELLVAHEAIKEAAVIGVPDDKWGEAVAAIVVLNDGFFMTHDEVVKHCRSGLASYKKPRQVYFRDALPRSSLGKVVKTELRDEFWRGRDRSI